MPPSERPADRALREARIVLRELGDELRRARVAAGLTQAEVARATGTSHSQVGRIEREDLDDVGIVQISRLLAVVGRKLHTRSYLHGSPRRDLAHAQLLGRLRQRMHPSFDWRTEVPFPDVNDPRSWDSVARRVDFRIGIEGETRPNDGQELKRRLAAKRRDGRVDRLILLLSDTRSNRAFLREVEAEFRPDFPIPGRIALRAFEAGRDPGGDAIILL
ncbi:MAG: helix-turn-helix transcriptional regulator [Candidatus Limnocylindrales bacterium]